MKKIIALLLAALLIAAVSAGVAADTALAGDCNGDGELDNKDVVVLFRFVSGGAEGVVEANCDFNGDGVTDNKDVVALFRHLSGSEGETDAPEYNDGVIGGKDPSDRDPDPSYPDRPDYYPDTGYEGIEEKEEVIGDYEPVVPSETGEYPIDVNYPDPVAGTISAGEWKDADNIEAWKQLLSGEEWQKYINDRNLDTTNVITVKVVDGENACFNVTVRLMAADSVIYAGRTDVNGYSYLFYDMTAGDNAIPDSVAVGEETVSLDGRTELEIEARTPE